MKALVFSLLLNLNSFVARAESPVETQNIQLKQQVNTCLENMTDFILCRAGENSVSFEMLQVLLHKRPLENPNLLLEYSDDRFELVGIKVPVKLKEGPGHLFFWCPGDLKSVKVLTRDQSGKVVELGAKCIGINSPLED